MKAAGTDLFDTRLIGGRMGPAAEFESFFPRLFLFFRDRPHLACPVVNRSDKMIHPGLIRYLRSHNMNACEQ